MIKIVSKTSWRGNMNSKLIIGVVMSDLVGKKKVINNMREFGYNIIVANTNNSHHAKSGVFNFQDVTELELQRTVGFDILRGSGEYRMWINTDDIKGRPTPIIVTSSMVIPSQIQSYSPLYNVRTIGVSPIRGYQYQCHINSKLSDDELEMELIKAIKELESKYI